MTLEAILKESWDRYCEITPDAARIHHVLSARGETILNDHVAFRTFDIPGITRLDLGRLFEGWEYRRQDDMDFPQKKLKATYWLHPDPRLPKIFISELRLDQVSAPLREWILSTVGSTAGRRLDARALLERGWEPPRFADYQRFYDESEYAAWTAAFGIRVNHFTVAVNSLRSFASIEALAEFLGAQGFELNRAGGVVKGTAAEGLEQISTLARRIPWRFAGGETQPIMSCYYEFARRFSLPGKTGLFQGFIPKSADKIFESTFEKREKR